MPDTPLYLPTPRRPDSEATWAELARFGTTAGDAYNVAGSAYDGVLGHDVELDAHGNRLNGLEGRTDLLEGVVAYGNVSMTRNEWVSPLNGFRPILRFGQQVGPMKGVSIVPAGDGLQLNSAGLWRVDCWTMANGTPFTGDPWAKMSLEIHRPAAIGGVYETKVFQQEGAAFSVGGCHSFVVPSAGYRVFAFVESGRWRLFLGGTLYSTMSVNKWDINTTAQAPGTVPNGPGSP